MIIVEPNRDKNSLEQALKPLKNLELVKIYRSIGTVLVLDLGRTLPGEEEKKYPKHEGYIRVELCNWRLLKNYEEFLIDQADPDVIDTEIKFLENKTLLNIQLTEDDEYPIDIIFSDGYVLQISDTWIGNEWGLTFGLPDSAFVEVDKKLLWRKVSSDHISD